MSEPTFFTQIQTLTLRQVAEIARASLPEGADGTRELTGVAPLETAGPSDLAYMDNPVYAAALATTRAGACLVSRRFAAKVPQSTVAIVAPEPYRVFAQVLAVLFPSAMRPGSAFDARGISPGTFVHPTARLEHGVTVDPGRGDRTWGGNRNGHARRRAIRHRSAGADRSRLLDRAERDGLSRLCGQSRDPPPRGAHRPGRVRIRHGPARPPQGPQIGRVIIQDDVEIGANSTVDRGASRDTVIGEGTKIDNLVQIAHNVVIGRHCVIVAQVGIAGSTTVEDFAAIGGQVAVRAHGPIGAGAQDRGDQRRQQRCAGRRWGGIPACPMRGGSARSMAWKKLAAGSESPRRA